MSGDGGKIDLRKLRRPPKSVELLDEVSMDRNPSAARLVEFGEETPSEIDTAHLTPDVLRKALEDVDLEGPIATAYRTDLQVKLAAPLACLLLPLIALFFAARTLADLATAGSAMRKAVDQVSAGP